MERRAQAPEKSKGYLSHLDVISRPGPGNRITEAEKELIMRRNANYGGAKEFDMAQTGVLNIEWIQWKNIEAI